VEAACLALVASSGVDDTPTLGLARVLHVATHRALEEPSAAVTARHAVVLARSTVTADQTTTTTATTASRHTTRHSSRCRRSSEFHHRRRRGRRAQIQQTTAVQTQTRAETSHIHNDQAIQREP